MQSRCWLSPEPPPSLRIQDTLEHVRTRRMPSFQSAVSFRCQFRKTGCSFFFWFAREWIFYLGLWAPNLHVAATGAGCRRGVYLSRRFQAVSRRAWGFWFLLCQRVVGQAVVPWRSEGVTVVGGLWLAAGLSQAARLDPTASSSEHAGSSSGTVPCWHCGWGRGGCP